MSIVREHSFLRPCGLILALALAAVGPVAAVEPESTRVVDCMNGKKECEECEEGSVAMVTGDEVCELGNSVGVDGRIDTVRLEHHHVAVDFALPGAGGASGCAPCGAGAALPVSYDLPSLRLERHHRYRRLHYTGSFGPGVFSQYDSFVRFETDQDGLRLVDIAATADYTVTDNDQDGVYSDAARDPVAAVEMLDDTDTLTAVRADAAIVVTTHRAERFTFEVIRTGAASTTTRYGRLVSIADRNGNAITLDYVFAADATDLELNNDRSQLWMFDAVTDAYGNQALITHKTDAQVGGRWVIEHIDVPVGGGTERITYIYDLAGLGIPEVGAWDIYGLSGVSFPDGSLTTLTQSHDSARQLQAIHFDEAAVADVHRRKDVYFTLESWTDPDTLVVYAQGGRMVRRIDNGEGELVYLNWVEDSGGNQAVYTYAEGRVTTFLYDAQGNMLEKTTGQALDANGDPVATADTATWSWDYNARGQVTAAYDALYDPAHPDLHVTEYGYDTDGYLVTITIRRTSRPAPAGSPRGTTTPPAVWSRRRTPPVARRSTRTTSATA